MQRSESERIKVLFTVSEAVPLIKTGGLADVAGTLPKFMDAGRFDCRVILPLYEAMKPEWRKRLEYLGNFQLSFAGTEKYVGIFRLIQDGICFYLVDNEEYFSGPSPYEGGLRDIEKFIYFDKAVLEFIRLWNWKPEVIHCHDWQTGLVPPLLCELAARDPFYAGIRTVYTIHNLKFQGIWNMDQIRHFSGLPEGYFGLDGLEYYGNANMMKGGIVWADAVTTVSESYAKEILTPEYGEGLDGLLRRYSGKLSGILNGIDTAVYNPKTDPYLEFCYGIRDANQRKKENKCRLQKELGLKEEPEALLAGMVSRLTDQKGLDLLLADMEELLRQNLQIAILGTGERSYEQKLLEMAARYPGKLSVRICFSEEAAHRIYGAADLYLMPSRFEPCGLSQLIALRYGTLPLVRETGGLKDTVIPYNCYTGEGTGFSFAGYSADELKDCVVRAQETWAHSPAAWKKLIRQAMKADFSWSASAEKYQKLYSGLMA